MKQIFKVLNGHVLIQSIGQAKKVNIHVPLENEYAKRRVWIDKENRVYAVAPDVKGVSVGDRVFLKQHVKIERMDETTKLVSELAGAQTTVVVKDAADKDTTIDSEKYFFIPAEDILCVIDA